MSTRTDSERIAVTEAAVLDMQRRLFGNGQPGVIERIENRLTGLEQWRWKLGGGLALLLILGELAIAWTK